MKEPEKIPLTDNPKVKEPERIRLGIEYWKEFLDYEDHLENNPQSIQKLESDKTN